MGTDSTGVPEAMVEAMVGGLKACGGFIGGDRDGHRCHHGGCGGLSGHCGSCGGHRGFSGDCCGIRGCVSSCPPQGWGRRPWCPQMLWS